MPNHNKYCYCETCDRSIHYLGIAAHRAAHKRKSEDCVICYSGGDCYEHPYSGMAELSDADNQAAARAAQRDTKES